MGGKNLVFKYDGLLSLIVGLILNIRILIGEAWPTYIYIVLCFLGFIKVIISFTMTKIKIGWQIFWVLFSYISFIIFLNTID